MKYYSKEALEAPIPDCGMYEYLERCSAGHLDEPAVCYFKKSFSYRELFGQIDAAARAFSALGVEPGEVVTLALPNIAENLVSLYALNRIGATSSLVDLRASGERLARYFNETDTRIAIVSDIFLQNALDILSETSVETLIVASPYGLLPFPISALMRVKNRPPKAESDVRVLKWRQFCKLGARGARPAVPPASADDVACILHTSGTSGPSKGVMLTNRNFNAMTVQYRHCGLPFEAGDTFLNQVPPFLAYNAILATHLPLVLGMKLVLLPDYEPHRFSANVRRIKPNHVVAGPADWGNFLDDVPGEGEDLSFLKTLASGSDTMRPEAKVAVNELLGERGCRYGIIEGYGMTEVGSAACTNLPQCDVPGTLGVPLPKMSFCACDPETGEELSYGEAGELCFTGPTLMKGYWNEERATAEAMRVHADGLAWMHSGDLGSVDADGLVRLEGRLKRIIVRHDGLKASPFAIERAVLSCEGAAECCAVAMPDAGRPQGSLPVAFVVLADGADESSVRRELAALCERELPEYARPADLRFIAELPLTPAGKVDYRELEHRALDKGDGKVSIIASEE